MYIGFWYFLFHVYLTLRLKGVYPDWIPESAPIGKIYSLNTTIRLLLIDQRHHSSQSGKTLMIVRGCRFFEMILAQNTTTLLIKHIFKTFFTCCLHLYSCIEVTWYVQSRTKQGHVMISCKLPQLSILKLNVSNT